MNRSSGEESRARIPPESEASPAGWTLLWDRILAHVRAVAGAVGRDCGLQPEDRENAVQGACLRIWLSSRTFDPNGVASLRTWVGRQTHYATLDVVRNLGRAPRAGAPPEWATDPGDSPEEQVLWREALATYRRCLAALPPGLRDKLETANAAPRGTRREEIARTLGVAMDTLKKALADARARVRECMTRRGYR